MGNTETLNPFVEAPADFRAAANGGEQWEFKFANGYGASVIRSGMSYGGTRGLWELAVLKDNDLCYETPITDDVIGYQSEAEIRVLLQRIAALPAVSA